MEIKVTKNKIHLDDKSKLNENEYNINNIDFIFSEEYTQELVKIALFSANNTNYKEIITQNQCKIPSEILANEGVFVLGVYAYSTEDVYKLTEDTEIDEDKTYYTRTGSGTEEEPYEYTEVENPIAENLSTYYEKNVKLSLRYSPSPIKLVVDSGSYIPDEQTQNSEPITASELEQYQQALNDGLREAENVNISAEKVDKVATITIIDRYGEETSVEIQDGTDGIDGKDAKINGVNTLTIKAGQNIEIEQEENTLIINGQSNYNNLTNKPKINNVELTGNKTTSDLGIVIPDVSGFITKDVNNLTNYTLKTATGSLIDLEINQSNYVVSLSLKDIDGNVISTDNIDLPLESVVVGGSYDATNKKIVLTLENGNTVDIPVGDLIAGLQTEITSQNKLASDLVDDTNSGNKFVTTTEKQAWNNKLDESDLTDYVKNTDYATSSKAGVIKTPGWSGFTTNSSGDFYPTVKDYETYDSAGNNLAISKGTLENVIVGKNLETANNKVTEIDETSTDTEYPSAKLLYDELAEKQEQIDGLVTENALLKDQIPNGTAEGTNVQITDSSNLPIEDGMLKGNTEQDGEPTPDTPQEIKVVTGNNTIEICGKNLFDKDNANILNANINGKTGEISSFNTCRTAYIQCKPNTIYTVSRIVGTRFIIGTTTNTPTTGMVCNQYIENNTASSLTITTGANDKYLAIFYYLSTADTITEQEILDSIQIEKSSTATPYTPHAHQTFPISLGTIELCKIGDYQDYLFKNTRTLRSGRANPLFNPDLDEGDWYKYSAIGKVVLDGSESQWLMYGSSGQRKWYLNKLYFGDLVPINVIKNKSNRFKSTIYIGGNWDLNKFGWHNSANSMVFDTDFGESLEEWKTWLSTHNTEVYYVLATPTYTKITDTVLIAQLEAYYNSSTYRNITNIITTGDDLAPIASIVYKKDLTTLFNKLDSLEARVDLLEE